MEKVKKIVDEQNGNTNKEIEIEPQKKPEILELKSVMTEMKISL